MPEPLGRALTFEVCTENVASVIAAEAAGAHRIELCSALAEGGVTPSLGLFQQAQARSSLPLHILIRPRAGDFCYTESELEVMLVDIALFRKAGASGIVVGALDASGDLSEPQLRRLLAAADPLPVTFHRAFDVCREPLRVLEQLIALGVTRLLTSGQAANALGGAPLIRTLVDQAAGRLAVMAGAGIDAQNIVQVAERSGVSELHFSAQVPAASATPLAFGTPATSTRASIGALIRSFP